MCFVILVGFLDLALSLQIRNSNLLFKGIVIYQIKITLISSNRVKNLEGNHYG